jgi:hypothetical protein
MVKGLLGGRQRPPLKMGLDVLWMIVAVLVLTVGLMWALIAGVFASGRG